MRSALGVLLILPFTLAAGYVPEHPAPANPPSAAKAATPAEPRDPLAGPFPGLEALWRRCHGTTRGITTTTLAERRAPGGVTVSLREYRVSPSAASCAVTIQSRTGLYVGPTFLCVAGRSDEEISTARPRVAITGSEATVRFAVSYLRGDFLAHPEARKHRPAARDYEIRCSLAGPTPRCEPPPDIGGYGVAPCQ
jgi:hypothetical protein